MSFFRKARRTSVFAIVIIVSMLMLQALDFNSSTVSKAASSISPSLLAQIGATDCVNGKGFNLNASDQSLLGQLQSAAGGGATISCHSATGKVRFFSAQSSKSVAAPASLVAQANPEQAARAFMSVYGPVFGLRDQVNELRLMKDLPTNHGTSFVRFQQQYKGVPVIAGEIITQVGANNSVLSVGGEIVPDLDLDVSPQITSAQAENAAQIGIAKLYGLNSGDIITTKPELWIYNPGLLQSQPIPYSLLVWRLTAQSSSLSSTAEPFEELVFVNAQTGNIALNFNQIAEAKDRRICNSNNTSYASGSEPDCVAPVRVEGQNATGVADVDNAYDYSGATYDFYFNNFGRDSLNGSGLPLKNTVKMCENGYSCPYANAFWSGAKLQMYYGDSFASADDVVGHELTHGLTQYTSNLLYYYQSGAINESMSDVFGEFVDQTDGLDGAAGSGASNRWLLSEDLPIGAIRNMKNPPAFSDPDKVSSAFYFTGSADSGGVHTNSGVNNKASYLIVDGTAAESGGAFNGQTIAGIGLPKAAQIYYEVETHLLTSGSDYQDLYDYLPQACQNLIGFYSITNSDCTQVKKAVVATEMNLTPATFRAEAPICSVAGTGPNNLFFDNMENTSSGKWSFASTVGANAWSYGTFPYNTSGTHHLEGADLATTSDSTASMTSSITLPPNAFMHFRHYFFFDSGQNWDGGVLEYKTDSGGNWIDASSLFDTNGYVGTLQANTTNPLKGKSAFTTYNNVYYSSRLNLSTLSGQSVRFRFRVGSDATVGSDGWWIDDVRIYTCDTVNSTSTSLDSVPNPSTVGQSVIFTATVTSGGGVPTGNVSFYEGNTLLGTSALNAIGIATYSNLSLSVGTHQIRAVYGGMETFSGSTSDAITQTVNQGVLCTTVVANNLDDGTCGTLRLAILAANSPGAPVKTVDATALADTTINLLGSGIEVGPGVTINGPPCSANGPTLIIRGAGITGDGFTLNGATLNNLAISGFNGRQIVANGTQNKVSCVKTSRN